jgi:hypothetical protein
MGQLYPSGGPPDGGPASQRKQGFWDFLILIHSSWPAALRCAFLIGALAAGIGLVFGHLDITHATAATQPAKAMLVSQSGNGPLKAAQWLFALGGCAATSLITGVITLIRRRLGARTAQGQNSHPLIPGRPPDSDGN